MISLSNERMINANTKRRKNEFFECSRSPTMLRAARELRTVILNGWKSYEMEAAVKMMRGEAPFDGVELR